VNIKDRFDQLTPGGKKIVIWSVVGGIILLITVSGYHSRSDKSEGLFPRKATREIHLDPDLIDKTMLREQRRQLDELQKSVAELKKDRQKPEPFATEEELPLIPSPDQVAKKVEIPPPPAEQMNAQQWPVPPAETRNVALPPPPPKEIRIIGEIGVLTNTSAGGEEPVDKKKGRTVYLPPSFMEAKLLTGFDASTSGQGRNNPEPLLLRIQTPAVLPNDVKANLAGCFVMAEAVGRLDKERADVRLVSLSCLSNEGKAIIDTPVKGFVTDSDSKVGLAGRVVSRMGAATARTIVAGFFGGMDDMLKATATTQSTSPLGTTTSVDSSQIAKYSLGGGLSEGAASLHDFYLSLAKQATPVIEVGATKKITVIISEGKELEIREIENDETL